MLSWFSSYFNFFSQSCFLNDLPFPLNVTIPKFLYLIIFFFSSPWWSYPVLGSICTPVTPKSAVLDLVSKLKNIVLPQTQFILYSLLQFALSPIYHSSVITNDTSLQIWVIILSPSTLMMYSSHPNPPPSNLPVSSSILLHQGSSYASLPLYSVCLLLFQCLFPFSFFFFNLLHWFPHYCPLLVSFLYSLRGGT